MSVYLFDGEAMDGKGVTVLGVEDKLYYTLGPRRKARAFFDVQVPAHYTFQQKTRNNETVIFASTKYTLQPKKNELVIINFEPDSECFATYILPDE